MTTKLSDYPDSITTDIHNVGQSTSFVPQSAMIRIVVTPVTGVSDKQIEYAMSRKLAALESIDKIAARMYGKMRAEYKDALIVWRNRMLLAINGEQSAKVVLDKLADVNVTNVDTMVAVYGIKIV